MFKRMVLNVSSFLEKPFPQEKVIAGRYRVIKHLGTGSYGHSYLVFDNKKEQRMVLKALRLHKRLTRSGRNSFELEKELLLSIDHPGFPKYFEGGVYHRIPFYTMEFIDGMNFEQLIFFENRKITELEAFKITDELLELIEYLHNQKIIHRDIRIPNVILDGNHVRLIDLGLGSYYQQGKKMTFKGFDLRKERNFQADFYGLGHFLLFLLYSNFSFQNNSREESWEKELEISTEAKSIIRRLLQIDPSYDGCAQIKKDIKKIII